MLIRQTFNNLTFAAKPDKCPVASLSFRQDFIEDMEKNNQFLTLNATRTDLMKVSNQSKQNQIVSCLLMTGKFSY